MDIVLAYSPEDIHSVADRDKLEDIATVGAEQNMRRSCWDVSIAERTVSQLWDICPVVSSRLPTELWEQIIDLIADDGGHYHMRRLGQVCRGWYARCRFHHYEKLYVRHMDRREVYRLINTLVEHPDRCSAIRTVWFRPGQSIGRFGSFAVRMVQKLPRVEVLRLWDCKWESGQLHAQVSLHITLTFGSVTRLELLEVTFPSAVVFGRLMRALPCLSSLGSDDVINFLASISAHIRHLTCYGRDLEKLLELLAVIAESLLSLKVAYFYAAPSIDLTPAVNLRILALDGYLRDFAKAASFLSRISSPNLVEVTIKSWPADWGTLVSVQDELNSIDNDSFAQMDRVLSGRQNPALCKVTVLLRCGIRVSHAPDNISEGSWRTLLSSRLPALDASGRLL
ncbi:uncharacterized protein FIBRA_09273 [Fibroporia radiculosa]|uniref:F-box domain-containing protein n=1 Tax=Fibroporia radiculosa TaxID=599839 RepID=J7S679_9APHY|nr:uncharacterized protein FIBRA_09273 [Fibroporia radiculosa]CCM06959.1 predicted protein [Fibroporia radiculosa]